MSKGCLAHLAVVLWLFEGALFEGRVFFFRDIFCYYFPNYVFLEASLRQGTWPLWNPTSDAGGPFLMADPADLLLVGLLGAQRALRLALPLHVLLAMCGATALGRRLGAGGWGSWAAGALYGLSGFLLSSLNLFELSHGVAWAPWVVWAYLGVLERPSPLRTAGLGALLAAQASTLAAETVAATALIALVLTRRRPDARSARSLATALGLALLLSAPALLGARALVSGTHRAAGFTPREAMAYSLRPAALLDVVLPRFFGDPHTFSDAGFWGQPFFPDGYPYLLSLYIGPVALLLAARAGAHRLWLPVCLGLVLCLGAHGPLGGPLPLLMTSFRSPVKLFFLANLPLCLLAGLGLERSARRGGTWRLVVPGALLLMLSLLPRAGGAALSRVLPEADEPRAQAVQRSAWPPAFAGTGALCLAAGLALWKAGRVAPAAAVLAALDLLAVNGPINASAPAEFYVLRPEVRALLAKAEAGGERLFSFGVLGSDGVRWSPLVARLNSDVWLYYMDCQSLLPRTNVLAGLDAAFDEDRTGWAPAGSTLHATERRTSRFRELADRLRRASVRWVLSWAPLPGDLTIPRGEARLPEIENPLRLYELQGARPRAFWSEGPAESPVPDPRGSVTFERPDPHTILLHATSPPGLVVVTESFHPDWRVFILGDGGSPGPLRVDGGYLGFATPGGDRRYALRYQPSWRGTSLAMASSGLALAAALLLWGRLRGPRG